MNAQKNRRILIIDDNRSIHEDFRKILVRTRPTDAFDAVRASLFGEEEAPQIESYEVDSACSGEEGYDRVVAALAAGQPYAVAFVDMRMPPGWDGAQTLERLWDLDPEMQLVICTAFSDYSWDDLRRRFGSADRLLILKKPFDTAEVSQLACALSEKRHLAVQARLKLVQLEAMVDERTRTLQAEVAERQRSEEQLRHDAHHDALTGLANRTLLLERLARSLERCRLEPGFRFAVLYLDLDRFKVINDSLGHPAGDQLLIDIAGRLVRSVRALDVVARIGDDTAARIGDDASTDAGDEVGIGLCRPATPRVGADTLARVGGDEFVVLLDGLRDPAGAGQVAERILRELGSPLQLDGHTVFSSACIGIALSRPDYARPEDVLRDADNAVHQAKAAGRGRYAVFEPGMHAAAMVRLQLENDLRRALDQDELRLHYQPIIDTTSRQTVGVEALVRWQHPERGLLYPGAFIPLAEETGQIVLLGNWVLREACRQLRHWEAEGLDTLSVSVNVSSRQFAQPDFADDVLDILSETGADPHRLILEITESALMNSTEASIECMAFLRGIGLRFHLDDFGTGYSSLSYLHRMQIDALKIDRSFVNTLEVTPRNRSIVQAIVALAHALGLEAIAEGVETPTQLDHLRALKCENVQGYLFSRPVEAEKIRGLVELPLFRGARTPVAKEAPVFALHRVEPAVTP